MRKMSLLYKISFSALFIALGIILSRFLAGWSLFGLPFLKISLTMSVVFFSSFYLGPLFGTIVSFSIDLFGALLVPQGGQYDFLYSIPAILEGFIPYFIYVLFRKTRIDEKLPICLGIILLFLNAFIFYFVLSHDTFKFSLQSSTEYVLTPVIKTILLVCTSVFSILLVVGVILFKRKFKNKKFDSYYNIYIIAFTIFATYVMIKAGLSSLIFMYRLNYSYEIIFGTRLLTAFFSSIIHLIIVSIALDLSLRYGVKGALIREEIEKDVRK